MLAAAQQYQQKEYVHLPAGASAQECATRADRSNTSALHLGCAVLPGAPAGGHAVMRVTSGHCHVAAVCLVKRWQQSQRMHRLAEVSELGMLQAACGRRTMSGARISTQQAGSTAQHCSALCDPPWPKPAAASGSCLPWRRRARPLERQPCRAADAPCCTCMACCCNTAQPAHAGRTCTAALAARAPWPQPRAAGVQVVELPGWWPALRPAEAAAARACSPQRRAGAQRLRQQRCAKSSSRSSCMQSSAASPASLPRTICCSPALSDVLP